MFLLAAGQQRQAVLEARIALELTFSASPGALREMLVVFVLGAGRRPRWDNDGHDQRGCQ
jgi:hypothetical protein